VLTSFRPRLTAVAANVAVQAAASPWNAHGRARSLVAVVVERRRKNLASFTDSRIRTSDVRDFKGACRDRRTPGWTRR
jgi:hypothetical protein